MTQDTTKRDEGGARMTKGERDDLLRLVRQRERVCKTAAAERSAALLADFEKQISTIYAFDNDATWNALYAEADKLMADINARVDARAGELSIPPEFRPKLRWMWDSRGEAKFADRRAELRRTAKAEIEAAQKRARTEIEVASVNAQTEIMRQGLTSAAATAFLESLPAVEKLMPSLDVKRIEAQADEKKAARRRYYDA